MVAATLTHILILKENLLFTAHSDRPRKVISARRLSLLLRSVMSCAKHLYPIKVSPSTRFMSRYSRKYNALECTNTVLAQKEPSSWILILVYAGVSHNPWRRLIARSLSLFSLCSFDSSRRNPNVRQRSAGCHDM